MIMDTARVSLAFVISIMFAVTALCGQTEAEATDASVSEFMTTSEVSSWSISTIDMVGDVGEFTSLGLDSNDKVHISYYDSTNGDLKYATNAGGMWVNCAIDQEKTVGWFTSLALDSSNKVHISYYDEAGGNLKYATNAGGSWVALTIDSRGDVGRGTSIAIDSRDKVHISYQDAKNGYLKYATNADGSWTTCIVDTPGWLGTKGTSIAVDSGNRVHISYMKMDPTLSIDLRYATYAEGSWTISTIDRDYSGAGGYPSLALDSGGKVHISYGGGMGKLKYATNLGGSWTTYELDSCFGNPAWTSLAIDSCDRVHISYVNRNGGIGYATNAGGFWAISTVDSDYGHGTSLAIDSCGRVHISYVGWTKWDLKYATNSRPPPAVSLVLCNGTVLTMEEVMPVAEAIAINGDTIVAVGTNKDILELIEDGTRVVDLRGRTVLPGFIDPHSHALSINDIYASSLYPNIGPPYDIGNRWIYTWAYDDASSKRATVQDAIQKVLKGGWTSVTEMYADQRRLDDLIALDQEGDIRVRVSAYLPLSYQFQRWGDWYKAYSPGQEFSSKLRIGGVKIFADDGYYGQVDYFSQEELSALVSKVHDEGYQVSIHAMGTSAIDLALTAYQEALQGESNEAYRHRIEHVCVLTDDQIELMAEKGIIASFQMTWFTSNPWDIWDVKEYIGGDRVDLVGRWHDLLDAGVPSMGSTDYPWFYGTNSSAMATIYKAVTRIGLPATPVPQWELDQRITVEQALRLLTIDAAYGTSQEDVKGSIAVGKYADLVVLSENPLAVDPERLMDVYVLMTMVGGQVEYCAPGHEYLYGSVYSEAPDTSYLGTSSNAFLQTPTEELLVTSEAVTSYKESA